MMSVFVIMDGSSVLIETLWNVKSTNHCKNSKLFHCINRNIVECKAVKCNILMCICVSINRNIVECKVLLIFLRSREFYLY